MQSTREYLKELIDRGTALLNPKYDFNTIHSALQLSNIDSSQSVITWERDVKDFCHHYLREHFAYQLLCNTFKSVGSHKTATIVNYLERIYNDWSFWDSKEQKSSTSPQTYPQLAPTFDVFISHASADKVNYVNALKQSLDKLKINIFYDTDTLGWGDDWKSVILSGVSKAEFAIIIISENFFGREWTEKELTELLNRQNQNGQKIILPIIHDITISQLKEKYPAIADIQLLDSSKYSCDEIALKFAAQLIKRLKK